MKTKLPWGIIVKYIREDRLGNVDHQRLSAAVANLANVYEEGMGAMKYLSFLPIVFGPLGFCLFVIGAYSSAGVSLGDISSMSPLFFVGFFMIGFGGLSGILVVTWVNGLGRRAVKLEIGKMNESFPGLSFSIRSETQVQGPIRVANKTPRFIKNYFLVITNRAVPAVPAAVVGQSGY